MSFVLERGQEEFRWFVSVHAARQCKSIYPSSVLLAALPSHVMRGPTDSSCTSLYIVKSVQAMLGAYTATAPVIPVAMATNISNQAFSWRVETKGKGHSPAFKQHSEPVFGSVVSSKRVISNETLPNGWVF